MASFSGGMDFSPGQPIRLPSPPETMPARPLTLRCNDRPEVITGQTVRRGQFLIQPLRRSEPCFISPVTGTVRQVRAISEEGGYEVVIDPPGESMVTSLEVAPPRGRKLEHWFAAMRQVGPWADPDGKVGLIAQLEAAAQRPVQTVICVGLDMLPLLPDRSSN